MKQKTLFGLKALLGIAALLASFHSVAQTIQPKLGTPSLTVTNPGQVELDITVCASTTAPGAPFGFSLQWITQEVFDEATEGKPAQTWPTSNSADLCKASFSGKAKESGFLLGPGACAPIITIGDEIAGPTGASSANCGDTLLTCGQTYLIRSFAHGGSLKVGGKTYNYQQSGFSETKEGETAACDTGTCRQLPGSDEPSGCTNTQGFWKTHSSRPAGNNADFWPAGFTLDICGTNYTSSQLVGILYDAKAANLIKQYIAAKLNIATGDGNVEAAYAEALTVAEANLCDPDSTAGKAAGAALDSINNGGGSVEHCSLLCQ
jgi:hypothetical protein